MNFFTSRKARHTIAAVRAAQGAAEDAQPQDEPAAAECSLEFDANGWGEVEPHDVTSPGFLPAPDPRADATMVWRIPSPDGGPGLVIPPATLATEDALPVRTPGEAIPAALVPALRTEAADPAMLGKVADKLRALPDKPEPEPGAYLRAISRDGQQDSEPLHGTPSLAGTDVLPDGTAVAGLFLGCNGFGTWLADAVDPAWCRESAKVLLEMADHLEAARQDAQDGAAA